jgi:hypothetical protein
MDMDEKRTEGWYDEPRGEDAGEGPTTSRDEAAPVPVDLRDTHGNAGPAIGNAAASVTVDVEMPDAGPYPLPDQVERPFRAQPPAAPTPATADPSLSRAVDRAAAGLDPAAAGYDRSAEGPTPGPLGPAVDEEDPDAGPEPAGQWGSSG